MEVAPPAYVSLPVYLPEEQEQEEEEMKKRGRDNSACCFEIRAGEGSSASSSIGKPSDTSSEEEEEDEEDEVLSRRAKPEPLRSLDSLDEALPIKRGLSNFFNGKSKSFACLSEVANSSAEDLVKLENRFNKRRRIQMASKNSLWSRTASYASLLGSSSSSSSSSIKEQEEEEEEEEEKNGEQK